MKNKAFKVIEYIAYISIFICMFGVVIDKSFALAAMAICLFMLVFSNLED